MSGRWMGAAGLAVVLFPGCGGEETTPTATTSTGTTAEPAWQVPVSGLSGAVLSIRGTSASDVWAVGADGGAGPVLLHYDGDAWTQWDTGTTGDLWWLTALGDGRYLLVGAGGRVVWFDPASGTFEEEVVDASRTFFGTWAAAPDDIWVVGGDPNAGTNAAVVHHHDGTGWSPVPLPPGLAAQANAFKVWGAAPDDVWIVGAGGAAAHWDGTQLVDVDTGTTRTLFTVHGSASEEVYAVGGQGNAEIARWDGAAWTLESPEFVPQTNGVYARPGCDPVAVSAQAFAWVREDGAWVEGPWGAAAAGVDFHGVWVDEDCEVWAVGGDLIGLTEGLVAVTRPDPVGGLAR